MVVFVMNCFRNLKSMRVIAVCYITEIFSKCIFSCNYIKVELKIQCCLCMYVFSTFLKHCYDLCRHI